jgi:hypothetical protein
MRILVPRLSYPDRDGRQDAGRTEQVTMHCRRSDRPGETALTLKMEDVNK